MVRVASAMRARKSADRSGVRVAAKNSTNIGQPLVLTRGPSSASQLLTDHTRTSAHAAAQIRPPPRSGHRDRRAGRSDR
ncbi:hypothetical protein GCM10009670_17010 [Citricoccus alkalitolerans]